MAPYQKTKRTQLMIAAPMEVVGLGRLELPTSRLSSARSNQLSYKPSNGKKPEGAQHKPQICDRHASAQPLGACSSAKKEKRRRRVPPMELFNLAIEAPECF